MHKVPNTPKVSTAKLSDLIPDSSNANDGTELGAQLLRKSVQEAGIGRGIVVDQNNTIIGGNKTHGTIESLKDELGIDNIVLVDTDGKTLVVTRRTDLNVSAEPGTEAHDRARTLAIADNRAGEANLSWNDDVLDGYEAFIPVDDWFQPVTSTFDEPNLESDSPTEGEQSEEGFQPDPENGESQVTEGERSQRPKGMKTPLAIALNSKDVKRWKALKERYGTAGDTTTLLKIMDELEGD